MTTTLPREWCRGPQWVSDEARARWEPVLRSAQAAWEELEPASITEGIRDSALVFLTPEELVRASNDCARAGLEVTPLAVAGPQVRAAVHRPGLAQTWRSAWNAGLDDEIGKLLGFPECCRRFFQSAWVESGSRDVTRLMRSVDGPWEANTMLRWLGVRLVPHLPCSADCAETVSRARAYADAGRRVGVDVAAIEALLRLSVSYSALGGVAVVETPHFRFMAGTDASDVEERRERPEHPSGYRSLLADRRPEYHYDADAPSAPAPSWVDNGFSSLEAMRAAHDVVAGVACSGEFSSAADLGAGDGTLLTRLAMTGGGGPWLAVEADAGRAARGQGRIGSAVTMVHGRIEDILWTPSSFDVVLLMPGRLLEMGTDAARTTRAALAQVRRLVIYAYGDVLSKYGDLRGLCAAAGVEVLGQVTEGPGVAAAVGRVS